jgi:hypothetical protein|nr:MAG: hypothetical protein [Bacteriophage sp.]UWI12625.1 MAG: hypothetical protein [Bacteriophage sp.]
MNKERRDRLSDVIASLEEAKDLLEDVKNDEQDAFDNMPVGLQCSERGSKMEDYIELMEDAGDQIDNVCEFIEKNIIKKR